MYEDQYKALFDEITSRLARGQEIESQRPRIQEFFVSNGRDLKETDRFLQEVAAYIAQFSAG